MTCSEVIYHPRVEATSEAEISELAGVYSYLINTHFSKKTVECAAFDDRHRSITIRTQCKEAPSDLSDPECDAEGDGTDRRGQHGFVHS